jgi:pimeloyl-ACP methyl ester carboxylesterase
MPKIPFVKFPGSGLPLHFAHANGYPPQAYQQLLSVLSAAFDVFAMEGRALWPNSEPASIKSWDALAGDLIQFLETHQVDGQPWIGVGHSVGGTTTLMAALRRPDLFQALVIIDPPIFPPIRSLAWRLATILGLGERLHPLTASSKKRRRRFDSRESMLENYREKRIFKQLSDQALSDYVNALSAEKPGGEVLLRYPPEWETRIYVTSMLADFQTWRRLPGLQPPVIFLKAQHTNAFHEQAVRLIRKKLPQAVVQEIPASTHLVPMEFPSEIAGIIRSFVSGLGL